MPVLVEGISVIVRRDAIDRSYRGGWAGFELDAPNQTLCMDAQIARVGFMSPIDVEGFMDLLVERGLTAMNEAGAFVDLVVIDQMTGPTRPCDWIEFLRVPLENGRVGVARFRGNTETNLVTPKGWTFERSLSRSAIFQPGTQPDANLEFLRAEDGVTVYRDRRSGREVFIGRTTSL